MNQVKNSITNTLLCECSEQLEEKLKESQLQDELNEEEVQITHEKIDVVEHQNTLNLERLEDYALREEA